MKKQPQDAKTRNDRKQAGKNPDERQALDPRKNAGGRWGDLPAKLHQDAEKARNAEVPDKYRDAIERYRQATAD